MALVLSLEASARFCSAAIHRSGVPIGESRVTRERSAAARLAPAIQDVFGQAGIRPEELQAVAVAEGPGSYTGLRIASSTAKGICMALGIPLIAVNTLQALASAGSRSLTEPHFDFYCPLLDARRMEVYCQWFDRERNPVSEITATILSPDCFHEQLSSGSVLFLGDAVEKAKEVIRHPAADFLAAEPDAVTVGECAWPMFLDRKFSELEAFEPRYLKEFIVGRKPV